MRDNNFNVPNQYKVNKDNFFRMIDKKGQILGKTNKKYKSLLTLKEIQGKILIVVRKK